MKVKKMPLLLISILFVLVSSITGCNIRNNASSNFVNANILNLESTDLGELKEKNVSITIWNTLGGNTYTLMENLISKFENIYPNFKVSQVSQGSSDEDLDYNLYASIAAKTSPTMAIIGHDYIADYISYDAIEDMNCYIQSTNVGLNEEKDDYLFLENGKSYSLDTSLYSLPLFNYSNILYYDSSLLTNEQISKLDNILWDDSDNSIISIARELKKLNPDIIPIYVESYESLFITLSMQFNIPYVSLKDNTKGSIDFANEETIYLIKKIKGWIDEGLLFIGNDVSFNTKNPFRSNVALLIGSSNKYSNYSTNYSVRATLIPQQNINNCFNENLGQEVIILKNNSLEEKIVAWLFYKFITTSENSLELSLLKGCIPIRKSSQNLEDFTKKIENNSNNLESSVLKLYDSLSLTMKSLPTFVGSLTARKQVGLMLQAVSRKDISLLNEEEIYNYIYSQLSNAYSYSVVALKN